MTTIKERFEALIDYYANGNKSAFSRRIGVAHTVIENIVGKRGGDPSFSLMRNIFEALPDINLDWLMFGRGAMLKSDTPPAPVAEQAPPASDTLTMQLINENGNLREEIGRLRTENAHLRYEGERLRTENENLHVEIENLHSQLYDYDNAKQEGTATVKRQVVPTDY
jgi:hypothetical protein